MYSLLIIFILLLNIGAYCCFTRYVSDSAASSTQIRDMLEHSNIFDVEQRVGRHVFFSGRSIEWMYASLMRVMNTIWGIRWHRVLSK